VQLALDPLRTGAMPIADVRNELGGRGIRIVSAMMSMEGEDYSTLESIRETGGIVPDATWSANREAAHENARIAKDLGITLVTFHAGFVPHEKNAKRAKLVNRLREMAEIFAARDVSIALETGQENAATLAELLNELRDSEIGVNFDPANMILYGMGDPVGAVAPLAKYIRQVHIKDAVKTGVAGTWGAEVPAGAGDVQWFDFFRVLREERVQCDFVIEREAGDNRMEDIRAAVALLQQENAL
jgi:sugar phosphate isomerase/epimerase